MDRSKFIYKLPDSNGRYFGTTTDMYMLSVGTKFSVDNGVWDGEIVKEDGKKFLHVIDTGKKIELKPDFDYALVITIEEPSEEGKKELGSMINYGLDGEQKEAIQWAIRNLESKIEACKESIQYTERNLTTFRPSPVPPGYYNRLNKKKVDLEERLERYKKHLVVFRSLVNQYD
jgi:hypothetical protein